MYEADLLPDILLEILASIAPASEEQAALNNGTAGLALAVDAVVQEPNGVRDATLQAVARGGVLCSNPDWLQLPKPSSGTGGSVASLTARGSRKAKPLGVSLRLYT